MLEVFVFECSCHDEACLLVIAQRLIMAGQSVPRKHYRRVNQYLRYH